LNTREIELNRECLSLIRVMPDELLSRRENEVLSLLQKNPHYSNKDLAISLGISERTVKFHVHSILAKFGAKSRIELCQKSLMRRGA
jgi:DNA-binding CsgD family transcriptional regulator